MFTTNHAATAFVIALSVKQPELVIPLSFASHFALDALPHFGRHPQIKAFNQAFKRVLAIDSGLALLLAATAALIWSDQLWLLAAASIAATLPDMLWLFEAKLDRYPPLYRFFTFHHQIQWGERPNGLIYELPWLALMLGLLASLRP